MISLFKGKNVKHKKIYILSLLFISLIFGCTAFQLTKQQYTADLTYREKDELLWEHNKWRRQVGVPDLKWSTELERIAKNWAYHLSYTCKMVHSDHNLGENIFWANYRVSPKEVVNYWANERHYYDYQNNSCRENKKCGHYTQIVWRTTEEVGCGKALCRNGEEIWVCNYRPAGNISNRRPY